VPAVATGIDLGSGAIKVAQIRRARGLYELVGAAAVPAGEPPAARATDTSWLPPADAVAGALRAARVRPRGAVLGAAGSKTILRYIQIPPVPPWKLKMMMRYEVDEGIAGGGASAYDYRRLEIETPEGGSVVMLGLAQEEMLEEGLRAAERAGVRGSVFDLSALGLFSAYRYGHGPIENETVAVLDVGESQVSFAIAEGERLLFARSAPGGGGRFTRAVETAFSLPRDEAEALKRDRGEILPPAAPPAPAAGSGGTVAVLPVGEGAATEPPPPPGGPHQRASEVLLREAGHLASTLESALAYCKTHLKIRDLKLDRVLLSGGGAALRGFGEYLSRRLRAPVEPLQPLRRVGLGALGDDAVREIEADVGCYAVAVGLALSRLAPDALRLDLLPRAVKQRRAFLERGLYLWYAAAAFVAALGLMIYTPLRNRAVLASEQEAHTTLLTSTTKKQAAFKKVHNRYQRAKAEVEALEERVLSGQDILDVFQALRRRTAKFDERKDFRNVWIVEVSTRKPRMGEFKRDPPNPTFQEARRLYVRGYAIAEAPGKVPVYVEDYIKHLTGSAAPQEKGLFVPYDRRRTEDRTRSRIRYQTATSVKVGRRSYCREFVLQLVLRPSRSEGP